LPILLRQINRVSLYTISLRGFIYIYMNELCMFIFKLRYLISLEEINQSDLKASTDNSSNLLRIIQLCYTM
jgi:hypothetical protein